MSFLLSSLSTPTFSIFTFPEQLASLTHIFCLSTSSLLNSQVSCAKLTNCLFFLLPNFALTLVCCQMAWFGIIFLYLHGYTRSHNSSCLDPFNLPTSYARGEEPFGLELESYPGPLASQAAALTTRPCLLGQMVSIYYPTSLGTKLGYLTGALRFQWRL